MSLLPQKVDAISRVIFKNGNFSTMHCFDGIPTYRGCKQYYHTGVLFDILCDNILATVSAY